MGMDKKSVSLMHTLKKGPDKTGNMRSSLILLKRSISLGSRAIDLNTTEM